MAQHNETGKSGENAAAQHLVSKGYRIIETNWRYRRQEIDIVARDGDTIVFVEVKTRTSDYLGSPAEAVTVGKQKSIVSAAHAYMDQQDEMLESRFDIVAVIHNKQGTELKHIEDAFAPRW